MSDITLKLLAMYDHRGDGMPTQYVNPDGPEAVEAILALRAALARISKLTPAAAGANTALQLHWSAKAIADAALATEAE